MLQKYRVLVALAISIMPHRDLLEVLDILLEQPHSIPNLVRRTLFADVEYRVQTEIEVGKKLASQTSGCPDVQMSRRLNVQTPSHPGF